jgi:hypothetical protein
MAIDTAPFSRRRPGDTTCCPLNATPQRPATASPSTDGDTTDFYGPINLAKALTSRAARPPYPARRYRRGSAKFAVFAIAKGKQKLTIWQLLQHNIADVFFVGRHVLFLAAIDMSRSYVKNILEAMATKEQGSTT